MRNYFWVTVLVAGLLVSSAALAKSPKDKKHARPRKPQPGMVHRMQERHRPPVRPPRPEPEMLRKMQERQMGFKIKEREMEMREREAEMEFEQQMRELELQKKRMELERHRHAMHHPKPGRKGRYPHKEPGKIFFMVCMIVNLLLAIWVYLDIRKRNAGSGIWIVVTLLAGFFGALLYTIARLGDKQGQK